MDSDTFDDVVKRLTERPVDRLAKPLAAPGSRRALLRLLAALPITGTLVSLLQAEGDAAGRRQRRKKHHKHQSGDDKRNRKGKHTGQEKGKGKDQPDRPTPAPLSPPPPGCTPTTCAAQGANSGSIPDGCGEQISCGPDSCGDGYTCTENRCLCPDGTAVCEGNCCQAGEVCQHGDGACCTAQGQEAACAGRECGPATDSCTGALYACGPAGDDCADRGFTCTPAGRCQCEAPHATCSTSDASSICCQTGQVCQNGDGPCCAPVDPCGPDSCDQIADNCGTLIDCGACSFPDTCGGGNPGTPNVCGCTTSTCPAGTHCDAIPNVCGGTVSCGSCSGTTPVCCNGACVNTQTDPSHCGSCTTACTGDAICRDGRCGTDCSLTDTCDANQCLVCNGGICASRCGHWESGGEVGDTTCQGGQCLGPGGCLGPGELIPGGCTAQTIDLCCTPTCLFRDGGICD